ncbi:MAG: penicillin-binding protein activator, partial [Desulfobacterales bacterium]|nr:penicillin-binding protein activator [Desulfobacterales bacterium]
MKLSKLIYVLILITLLACIPKTKIVSVQSHDVYGENLFSKAENLFNSRKYDGALESYNEYIAQFPGSHLIPAALMRMGTIYDTLGENEKARNSYMTLIGNYPKSNYASDVKIKVIEGYLKNGLFKEAVNYSAGILTENLSDYHISKIYILTGDAQIAIKHPSDALISYYKAGLKSTEREREIVDIKLKDSIAQLGITGIISLIKSIKDDAFTGYLQYQLGLRYYGNKKYTEAADVLHDFTQKMPAHRNRGEARILLQEIYAKAGSKPHTVGCLLPLTGAFNIFGNRALKGAALALDNFSNRTGHSINIVIRDTESNPEKAAAAVDELIKENVSAIIGPMGSAESVSAANKAQAGNIPIILLTQKENITDTGDFVFRNFLIPKMQVKSLVEYAVIQKGIKKFAVLYPRENYGTTFMNFFQDEVKAKGGRIIRMESYDPALMDFTDSIRILAGNRNVSGSDINESHVADNKHKMSAGLPVDFEAVFIPDSPAKAGLIIPQLA